MSVRVRYKITTYVSSTAAEEKDLANQTWEVVSDTQGEGGSWKSTLQPGDTDVRIYLGNLASTRLLIVRTNTKDPTQPLGPIILKRDSIDGEEIVVAPLTEGKEGHLLLSSDGITALYATNPSEGMATEVTVVAVGD